MPPKARDRLSLSLPAPLVEWVRRRATEDGVTISAFVERALVEYRHVLRGADERRRQAQLDES